MRQKRVSVKTATCDMWHDTVVSDSMKLIAFIVRACMDLPQVVALCAKKSDRRATKSRCGRHSRQGPVVHSLIANPELTCTLIPVKFILTNKDSSKRLLFLSFDLCLP